MSHNVEGKIAENRRPASSPQLLRLWISGTCLAISGNLKHKLLYTEFLYWERGIILCKSLPWTECLCHSQISMLSYFQYKVITRWGFGGVNRSLGWSRHEWDLCPSRREPGDLPLPFPIGGPSEKMAIHELGCRSSLTRTKRGILAMDFPASGTFRSKWCCWSHPVCSIFLAAAWTKKISLDLGIDM